MKFTIDKNLTTCAQVPAMKKAGKDLVTYCGGNLQNLLGIFRDQIDQDDFTPYGDTALSAEIEIFAQNLFDVTAPAAASVHMTARDWSGFYVYYFTLDQEPDTGYWRLHYTDDLNTGESRPCYLYEAYTRK